MSSPFSRLANFRPISRLLRCLQPGPLGIIEHKFSAEVRRARSAVEKVVENWKGNAYLEKGYQYLIKYNQ
ncbi:hypothetical protein MKW94_005170 [Papaver nudicaule]|uniref:Uncharacterized protein n=1 Tax=Papaver nudicaule TaxID=74823 RepID=A0AA41V0Q8_PAPNU|nr:hypothetical protein [Papaver nudicaule]